MQDKNGVSPKENIIPFNEFRLKQEMNSKVKEFAKLDERYNLSRLVEESYDLIDAIKGSELNLHIIARTKSLIQEIKNRCGDHADGFLSSLTKMQENLDLKISNYYKKD